MIIKLNKKETSHLQESLQAQQPEVEIAEEKTTVVSYTEGEE